MKILNFSTFVCHLTSWAAVWARRSEHVLGDLVLSANVKDSNPTHEHFKRQFWHGGGLQPEKEDPYPCEKGKKHLCCFIGTNFCVEYQLDPSHHLCAITVGVSSLRANIHLCCLEIKYKPFTGLPGPDPDSLDPAIGRASQCDDFQGVYSPVPVEETTPETSPGWNWDAPELNLDIPGLVKWLWDGYQGG